MSEPKLHNPPPRWLLKDLEDRVPGSVSENLRLGGNNHASVWLLRPASFPTGLWFETLVGLQVDSLKPTELQALTDLDTPPDGVNTFAFPRLVIEFMDGQRISNFDVKNNEGDFRAGLWQLSAAGDMLTDSLHRSNRVYRHSWYLSPLPSRGDITFIFEWPTVGIGETCTLMNGDKVRCAAARAHDLWA